MKLSIEKIIENEDGTKSIVLDYDDEMKQLAIDSIAHENPTEEEITSFLLFLLTKELEKKAE
jgi:hypothetical protein